ncbi:MAG: molecular chaperone TorD family protein [Candidatus Brocadiaceae bacterium]
MTTSNSLADSEVSFSVENLLTRSMMYQVLSGCFIYPAEKNLASLKSPDFEVFKTDLVQCFSSADNGAELKKGLDKLQELLCGTPISELQKLYQRLVGHTISKDCPLFETQYGAADVFQQTHELADIQGFYKAFGLDSSDVEKERCDHVSVELEFMHFLLYKQAYALENHGEEKAMICLDAQKKFLKEHIGKWVPLFTILFCRKAGDGFYYALSVVTREFLRLEMSLLGVRTEMYKESDLTQELVAGAPDECLSCATFEDTEV